MNTLRAALLALALSAGAGSSFSQNAPTPSRDEVQAAHDQVQKDPNLGGTKKEQKLRFKDFEPWKAKPAKSEPPPSWLVGLARWVAEAGRLVIWALGALAVALFIVGLRHWIRVRADTVAAKTLRHLPSHVRELDIRPESLPDQIGATARALWEGGEHHRALSLLYRGALSRLVHDHAVPIRAASTEGECVRLTARYLAPRHGDFFARLVAAWQLAVYGARMPESAKVLALCDDFDQHLGQGPSTEAAP
ncbi:DUF4129 domain-containing protein [Aquabacterium sp.]|uniref:DUF4129 domain-containing protein n=1 Tax=Aquabacterium sp. TaxID=1872578 RepID=UPI003D6C776C